MKISIDASRYGHEQSTGVEKYSYEIIRRVYKLALEDGHEVKLYTKELLADFPPEHQVVIKRAKLWTLVGLSLKMLFSRNDSLFVPSHVLPLIRPKKSVIMIHDVAFRRYPKVYSWKQRRYLNWSTKYAIKHASKILVPSKFTAQELEDIYGCPTDKIEVVHHGVSGLAEENDCLEKFGLNKEEKYMLFIGRLEYKKNLPRLVRAFASLGKQDWKLVLAGKGGYGVEKVFAEAKKSDARDRIIFTDYISDAEKTCLIKNAGMFVFPSLYEGFGLPMLEAFEACVPVVGADIPVLHEVGGQAYYPVHPLHEDDIAQGLSEVIRDEAMQERMIKMGRERLKEFDWDESARRTLEQIATTSQPR